MTLRNEKLNRVLPAGRRLALLAAFCLFWADTSAVEEEEKKTTMSELVGGWRERRYEAYRQREVSKRRTGGASWREVLSI